MEKKYNLWHMLGFHNYLNCTEFGDYGMGGQTKIEYSNPWSLFAVRYTRYICNDCGRKFWMPKGNFEEFKMMDKLLSEHLNK